MKPPSYIVVLADSDPVARAVSEQLSGGRATDYRVDGASIRAVGDRVWAVRRPGPHIHDDRLDERLPAELRAQRVTLVFPSIHRSSEGRPALTVHPLGNPRPTAEYGGAPELLVPTNPPLMTGALLGLGEVAGAIDGLAATFEATHHGPALGVPAFFVEVGEEVLRRPESSEVVRRLSQLLLVMQPTQGDRVAVGVGGGHYVPQLTDLARRRRWSFGHLLSRYALDPWPEASRRLRAAVERTPGAEGYVPAKRADPPIEFERDPIPRLRPDEARPRAGPAMAGPERSDDHLSER